MPLTINPAIDNSTTVAGIKPNSKLRCSTAIFEAGGDGITISKAIHELNESEICMSLATNKEVKFILYFSEEALVHRSHLATRQEEYITTAIILQKSTFGVEENIPAGMLLGLSKGKSLRDLANYGVSSGTAATMTLGSQLCKKKDVDALYKWIFYNSKAATRNKINA